MRRMRALVVAGLLMAGVGHGAPADTLSGPDLVCTDLSLEKVETMQVPLRLEIHVAVKNSGPGDSQGFTTRLSYRKDDSVSWTTVRELSSPFTPAGSDTVWDQTVDLEEGGTYTFKVEVDPQGEISETNEDNNVATVTEDFVVGTPDLTVTNVRASATPGQRRGAVLATLEWDVQNIGNGPAVPNFVTVVQVSRNGGAFVELARYSRSDLAAGASHHYTETYSFANATWLRFRILTDVTNTVSERSNANNSADSHLLRI